MNTPTTPEKPVPGLDPVAAQRWLQRAAATSPWLHEEVGSRMADRLPWFREQPTSWLHWEPVQGGLEVHRKLRGMLPEAACHVLARRLPEALEATRETTARSWNPLQWGRTAGPAGATAETRVRMLWANMALHMAADPQALIREWHSNLAVDGFVMFSCFGPDTLRELRRVFDVAGWPQPHHQFTDMHDWGDMLVHAGFAEPVMDMERITLTYETPERMLAELRELGRNLHVQRFAGLRGRRWREQLDQLLLTLARPEEGGRLTLSFEIVYGHALKPRPRVRVSAQTEIGLEQMRQMLHSTTGKADKV